MTSSAPVAEQRYVNGFVDGADLVLLYRDAAGQRMARRRRAEWSSFHRRAQVSAEMMRDLRGSDCVTGISEEGEWLRVRWASPEYRAWMCADEVQIDGKWVPGYFAEHGIAHLEADVDPVRRFFSETGAEVSQPRRVYVDIETDPRVPPAIARRGKARVLCWTLVVDDTPNASWRDRSGIRVVARGVLAEDTDAAEVALLEAFWKAAEPFDQLTAWFGDLFDFPILKLRAQLLGAKVKDFRRWLYVDQAEAHEKMNRNAAESGDEKESLALNAVAQELIGEGKSDFYVMSGWDEWAAGGERRQRLVDYCAQDTLLLPRIERKTGYLALNATLCELSRCFQETAAFYPIPIIDGFLLRIGVERGMRFPSKTRIQAEKFAGAYVYPVSVTGIRRGVHAFDFSGMYPSIMMTWNMSPETIAPRVPVNGPIPEGTCRSPATRVGFDMTKLGIIPEVLAMLKERRKFWLKKAASLPAGTPEWYDAQRRSNAYKVAMNAIYGASGSPFCRFYARAVAESTSQTGAWLIQKTIHAAQQRGMLADYGDTDSAFVEGVSREQVIEFVKWCNEVLYPQVVAENGCRTNYIDLAYEKEFERIVFITKKRYFGVYAHYKGTASCECTKPNGDPGALDVKTMVCRDCGKHFDALPPSRGKPEIKGLEYKRGDANRLAKQLQLQVIKKLTADKCEDPAVFVPMIEAMRAHVLNDPLPVVEVQKSIALSRSLREYAPPGVKKDGTAKAELPQVQVAKILKARGHQIEEGVKIAFYVVDASESPMKVAPAADYANDADRHYLWENLVWPATERVLEATFPAAKGMSVEDLQLRDWGRFARTRPKKERGRALDQPRNPGSAAAPSRPAKASPPGQALLFAPPPPPPTAAPAPGSPYVVELDVNLGEREGAATVLRVKNVLRRHAGDRPVVLRVAGQAYDLSGLGVAWSVDLVREIEQAKGAA